MDTTGNIIVGSKVWVNDPKAGWIAGEVTEINGKNVTVNTSNGGTVVKEISSIYAKIAFKELLDRFRVLAPDVLDGSDEKKACIAICDKMCLKGYQMGKTDVFLRAGQMAESDARRAEVLGKATKLIQRQIRTHYKQHTKSAVLAGQVGKARRRAVCLLQQPRQRRVLKQRGRQHQL